MQDFIQKEVERLKIDELIGNLKTNLSLALEKHSNLKPTVERIENVIELLLNAIRDCDRTYTATSLISKVQSNIQELGNRFAPETRSQVKDLENDSKHYINNLLEIIPLFRRKWSEEERESFFKEVSEDLKTNYDKLSSAFVEHQNTATEIINDLRKKQTESEKLVQFLSEATISDFYAKKADEHKTSAKNWTYVTWAFACATIAVIIIALIYQIVKSINIDSVNYALLSSKILLTVTLGFTAKWTSKQATRHNIEEVKYRRLSLNMATLKPFIDTLEESKKNEVIAAIAIKTFTDSGINEFATDFEAPNLGDLLKNYLTPGAK